MAHWFHRNPLKSTATVNFDLKIAGSNSQALKICSELRQARSRLIELIVDPNQNSQHVATTYDNYLSLLHGFLTSVDESNGESKLRHSIRFRWTHSMLGTMPQSQSDVMFELVSISQNIAFWYTKHAAQIAAKDDISMDEAKEVHKCLRKAAGILKAMQDKYCGQLLEKHDQGSDLDSHVITAYIAMSTAEAQEVTVARAIEMKHKPGLISALANETAKIFTNAAESLVSLEALKFGKWRKYLQLKSIIYLAYAYCYCGEDLLAQDKCGEAIRALKEGEKCYADALQLSKDYVQIKGSKGMSAKPDQHLFFRKLGGTIRRTLEKCERENGFIYHQKVPVDPPQLELKATYGLVSPEEFEMPSPSPLWTPEVYKGFDLTLNMKTDSANSKAAVKAEGELPPVKEAEIKQSSKDPKNHSGCTIS